MAVALSYQRAERISRNSRFVTEHHCYYRHGFLMRAEYNEAQVTMERLGEDIACEYFLADYISDYNS